jgi:hypothetical protein
LVLLLRFPVFVLDAQLRISLGLFTLETGCIVWLTLDTAEVSRSRLRR